MLARAAKSDGKYSKVVTLLTTLVLVMSGLVLSPAHADPYSALTGSGSVDCGTSGTFTITNNVVTYGPLCAGAAVIPEGVTSIGDLAFFGATALTSITIPASVTIIGANAFQGAAALTSITIPASVTTIGEFAFAGATGLTSITIPASVTTIDDAAFYGATALTGITVAGANPNYSSAAGVLFNKLYKILIAYPAGKSGTSYTIPASVTSIGDGAFAGITALTSVTIPASVTSIGYVAFLEATSLTSITIPESVKSIGHYAFQGATALTSVYFLGDALNVVGEDPFSSVATGAKAYIKSGATDFDLNTDGDENPGVWFGLIVTIGVYTVTYNTSGGSAVAAQTYGANIATPTSPTRTGYTFAGWSATDGGSVITFPHTPASGSNVTLYAKWTKNVQASAKVKPTVSGTPKVSKTLTAKKGTWTGFPTPAFTYQWYSCSKTVAAAKATVPSTCKKITGATKSTLKLVAAQKGKFISVLVTGTSTGTTATKSLSKSTAIVK